MTNKTKQFARLAFCNALHITLLTALTLPLAYAGEGFDVGMQVGMSNNHFSRQLLPSDGSRPNPIIASPTTTGPAARLYFGWDGTYGGWEFGLGRYAPATYSSAVSNGSIHLSQIDIDIKGILPLATTGLSLFGKGGFAFLRATRSRQLTSIDAKSVTSGIYPIFSVGAAYYLTSHVVVDLSFTRVFSKSSQLPAVTFAALGFSYHFANAYCGQFLC